MTLDEIRTFLGQDWTDTEAMIRSCLSSDIDLLNKTNDAILFHGGKQLRPVVSLLVARACSCGKATRDSIRYAAASELLHNATLLHDDVADSSDERRGVPTVMSILGGQASVLIGDFWMVKAMGCILSAEVGHNEVLGIFAKTLSDLAEGEMLQLQKAESGDTSERDYYRIIYGKTASLFEALSVSAAISVGATEAQKAAARKYAVEIGIAFQIKDDMFDYSDSKAIGKPVGVDLDEQKITLPLLGALCSATPEENAEIRRKVASIHEHPESKAGIRDFVASHDGLGYSEKKLQEHVANAVSALDAFSDSKEKDYLARIAGFIAARNK